MGPQFTANKSLMLYWDFEDAFDDIHNVQLQQFQCLRDYGRCETSGLKCLNTDTGSKYLYTNDVKAIPSGNDFSFVFWWTSEETDAGFFRVQRYEDTAPSTENFGDSRLTAQLSVNDTHGENSGLFSFVHHKEITVNSGQVQQFFEHSKWNMFYAGVSGEYTETSINGLPKLSGDNYGGFEGNGNWGLKISDDLLDEFRVYDRLLTEDELGFLYNHAFPQPPEKEKPKIQYMYPASGESDVIIEVCTLADCYWNALEEQDDNNINGSEADCGFNSNDREIFSTLNEWHTPYSGRNPIDNTFTWVSHNAGTKPTIELNMGPFFVQPSSINIHFKAASMGIKTTMLEAHSGLIEDERGIINNIELKDAAGNRIIEPSGGFIIGFSGYYGSNEPYIHYESGLILKDLSSLDLTHANLSFQLDQTNLDNANLMVYGVALEVRGETNIAETGLGISKYMDLYEVAIGSQNSGIDLYTEASIPDNSGMDLYTLAHDVANSSIPLYTIAGLGNSGIDLFINGHALSNSGIDFYINGHTSINSGIDLYTVGANLDNAPMPMFAQATVYNQSGSLPFSMWSTTNSGKFSTIPMYLGVSDNSGSYTTMPMYLETENTGSGTTYMPMFVMSDNQENKSLEIFLQNSYTSGHDSVNLFAQGLGGLDGGLPVNDSMPLFIARDSEGDSWGVPMYLQTNSGENQSLNLFISGGTWSNKAVNLVIPSTYGPDNSGITFQVNGY